MDEKSKAVEVGNLRNGTEWLVTAVLAQGEAEGFFLVKNPAIIGNEPVLARAIVVELPTGENMRFVVQRELLPKGCLEHQVAQRLNELLQAGDARIQTGELGKHGMVKFVRYADLAQAVNEQVAGDDKRQEVKARTIGEICRESLGLPVERISEGWAAIVDERKVKAFLKRF